MRLTTKSQMTVPKRVREDMGIGPGSEVGLEKNAKGEYVLVKRESSDASQSVAERLIRHLKETGRRARKLDMTTNEVMELTRGPFNDLDPR